MPIPYPWPEAFRLPRIRKQPESVFVQAVFITTLLNKPMVEKTHITGVDGHRLIGINTEYFA